MNNTTAEIDGRRVTLDVPPQILNGRTLVPLRFVSEALGAHVAWQEANQQVTLSMGARTVILWVGRGEARIDGAPVPIDVPPIIANGRTLVPLRFAAESLGAEVQWNENDQTILLTHGGTGLPPAPAPAPAPDATVAACDLGGTGLGHVRTLTLHQLDPSQLVMTNDCHAWVYTDFERTLTRIRLTDGHVTAQAATGIEFHGALAYNGANDQLYRVDVGGLVEVFNGTTGAAKPSFRLPKRDWWDQISVRGAVEDPATGQLFIFSSIQLWAVDRNDQVTGPIDIGAGPGGLSGRGAALRGDTLWLLGQPWEQSPAIAVPVNTATLTPGAPLTLTAADRVSYVRGFSMDLHPTTGSFYVTGQDPDAGPFVAVLKDGQIIKKLFLPHFTGTPYVKLSPDGAYLAIWDPGASGTVITDREYRYDSVRETHQLFSVFGTFVMARSDDLTSLDGIGGEVRQVSPGWFVANAGKPTSVAYSRDGRYLLLTDTVEDQIQIFRIR